MPCPPMSLTSAEKGADDFSPPQTIKYFPTKSKFHCSCQLSITLSPLFSEPPASTFLFEYLKSLFVQFALDFSSGFTSKLLLIYQHQPYKPLLLLLLSFLNDCVVLAPTSGGSHVLPVSIFNLRSERTLPDRVGWIARGSCVSDLFRRNNKWEI